MHLADALQGVELNQLHGGGIKITGLTIHIMQIQHEKAVDRRQQFLHELALLARVLDAEGEGQILQAGVKSHLFIKLVLLEIIVNMALGAP